MRSRLVTRVFRPQRSVTLTRSTLATGLFLLTSDSPAIGLITHDRKQAQQFDKAENVMGFVGATSIYWNGETGSQNFPVAYNPPSGYDYVWFDK